MRGSFAGMFAAILAVTHGGSMDVPQLPHDRYSKRGKRNRKGGGHSRQFELILRRIGHGEKPSNPNYIIEGRIVRGRFQWRDSFAKSQNADKRPAKNSKRCGAIWAMRELRKERAQARAK